MTFGKNSWNTKRSQVISAALILVLQGMLAQSAFAGPPTGTIGLDPISLRPFEFHALRETACAPTDIRLICPVGGSARSLPAAATRSQGSQSGATPHSAEGWRAFPPLKQALDARSFLYRHGVRFFGWLQLDGSTVASGGMPNALGFDGQFLLDVWTTINTKQLFGWPGGLFLVDMQSHSGPNILTHQMPALQDPDNMDAYTTTSVDRAWYQQTLLRQKVQLQVGLMYVDDEFFTVPYAQNFVSLDFSSDASISTFVLPTFPKGSFGGNVFVYLVKGLYFSGGMYNDHSTELPYDPGGDLYLTEEGWAGSWRGLPYKLQVGAWRDTGRFQRFLGGVVRGQASGVYVVASRKLWQPKGATDRGIGTFFQFGTGPPAVAAVRRHYGAGVVWTGPSHSRPHDEIGFAFSDSLLTPQNDFTHGFENEFETYYQIGLPHGLTVQPDLEYWQHPGGGGTPNTVLVLTRIVYTF